MKNQKLSTYQKVLIALGLTTAAALVIVNSKPKITVKSMRQSLINRFSKSKDVWSIMTNSEINFSYDFVNLIDKDRELVETFLDRYDNRFILKTIQTKYDIFS